MPDLREVARLQFGGAGGSWSAPGRVNLIGEHTDYNDGFVLPFALSQQTTVQARLLTGSPRWMVTSAYADQPVSITPEHLTPGRVEGWASYVAGVLWALTDAGFELPGAEFAISSTVPVGAGLSSSAALECAILTAMCDLAGLDLPVADRPRLAQRAENGYVGMPCGIMDQSASTLCRAGHALFLDCRSLEVAQVPFDLDALGLTMVVIDSKTEHHHVDNEYALRRRACEQAARDLGVPALRDIDDLDAALARLSDPVTRRRVRHVVTENHRVLDTVELLDAARVRDIGPLLTASHASMRDDYEITVPTIDLAVEVALAAGAYGARMTGGGFGGCVIALVDADNADTVRSDVADAYEKHGYPRPESFIAAPAAGARRLS